MNTCTGVGVVTLDLPYLHVYNTITHLQKNSSDLAYRYIHVTCLEKKTKDFEKKVQEK